MLWTGFRYRLVSNFNPKSFDFLFEWCFTEPSLILSESDYRICGHTCVNRKARSWKFFVNSLAISDGPAIGRLCESNWSAHTSIHVGCCYLRFMLVKTDRVEVIIDIVGVQINQLNVVRVVKIPWPMIASRRLQFWGENHSPLDIYLVDISIMKNRTNLWPSCR